MLLIIASFSASSHTFQLETKRIADRRQANWEKELTGSKFVMAAVGVGIPMSIPMSMGMGTVINPHASMVILW